MKKSIALLLVILSAATTRLAAAPTVVDFADLALPASSYYNGSNLAGDFASHGANFNNVYTPQFSSWEGWSYSNVTDNTTAGYTNEYSAFPGGGAILGGGVAPGTNYAVAYDDGFVIPTITFAAPQQVVSVQLTNATYAALSMRDGDGFAKKFGGDTGNDPDYFSLTITGLDAANNSLGSVLFYLADYRFANNAEDYIVNDWTTVNLSSLGSNVKSLTFTLESSDAGPFGINTPAYFALDNLVLVPEPSAAMLLLASALGLVSYRRRS